MNSELLVSVALCTYNGERYISSQLDTIINQTYPNIEIIVVDDRSTDQTISILKSYQEAGKIKLYQNETNLGFIKNFEKAISLCNGEYIALSDQDDLWDLNKIEILVKSIKNHVLIYSDSEFANSEGESMGKVKSQYHNFAKGDSMAFILDYCTPGHAILFKKELINYLFPFPENMFHDWWITFAAINLGEITYIKDCLVKYRQHETSYTDNLEAKVITDLNKRRSKIASSMDARKKAIERTIAHLKTFYYCKSCTKENQRFILKLIVAYKQQATSYIAFRLLWIFILYGKRLFLIRKKSRLKLIAKEVVGIKSKVIFHKNMSYLRRFLGA